MTKIKVWGASPICGSFEELKYYNGNPQEIKVKGLKSHAECVRENWAKAAEKLTDPLAKECMKQTGMTPEQYQKSHKRAWNE